MTVFQRRFSSDLEPLARVENPCHRSRYIPWLILTLTLLVFAPVCRHGFVEWDDNFTIERNPLIQHPSLANVLHYWTHAFMDLYVPVTYTAWSAIAQLSRLLTGPEAPLNPRLFHTASVLLHAFNAILVFWLLRRLLKRYWPAAAGALLFALHPVQVEAVAWASGMKDVLCGTFTLLAVSQYVLAVAPAEENEAERGTGRRRVHYIAGIVAMILAMLSKPTAMITPGLALTIDLLILRRPWREVVRSIVPWFVIVLPCPIWTRICQPNRLQIDLPLWQRPLIATDALTFYLCKIIFPWRLTYDYGRSPWVAFARGWALWTWIVPAAIATAVYLNRKRSTVPAAAAILLVIGVAPVLGLTVFDFELMSTVADHYLYVAMLGPALLTAWALGRVSIDTWASRPWLRVAAPALLLLLAARTADQQRHWEDSEALFGHALDVNPDSWNSHYELGYLLQERATRFMAESGVGSLADRSTDEPHQAARTLMLTALEHYELAVRINPQAVAARHGRALVLMHFGRYRQAADAFADVLRRRDVLAPENRAELDKDIDALGQCQYNLGRYADAIKSFESATNSNPPVPGAAEHLAIARAALAASARTD